VSKQAYPRLLHQLVAYRDEFGTWRSISTRSSASSAACSSSTSQCRALSGIPPSSQTNRTVRQQGRPPRQRVRFPALKCTWVSVLVLAAAHLLLHAHPE